MHRFSLSLASQLALVAALAVAIPTATASDTIASLCRDFIEPKRESGPYTWWHWMNGNVSREGITRDLEAMRLVGLRGAYLFDIGGEDARGQVPAGPVRVLSNRWFEHVQHAADEAERLGLELLAHNCPGWSTTAGPQVPIEDSMKRLVWSETAVHGGAAITISLPKPEHLLGFYRDIAVLAVPGTTPRRVHQIDAKIAWQQRAIMMIQPPSDMPQPGIPHSEIVLLAGTHDDTPFEWIAPPGDWTLVRLGYTTTGRTNHPAQPEGRGFEVDKMDREAVRRFFNKGLPGQLAGMRTATGRPAFKALLIDSHEAGMQNWTPSFLSDFVRLRGYQPEPYLAALAGFVVDNTEVTDRFLWDFRRTLADLMNDCHVGEIRRLCRASGLEVHLEPYSQGNYCMAEYGAEADVLMTEFWKGRRRDGRVKPVASLAHTLGSNEVRAESFTTSYWNSGWRGHPWELKSAGDAAWANGVTRFVFHTWAHQSLPDNVRPGMTMGPWGLAFNQHQTWWEMAPAWLQYIQRSQRLLRSGQSHADIALLFDASVPNADVNADGNLAAAMPVGYDYDLLGQHLLNSGTQGDVSGLTLSSGTHYALLVLPEGERISLPTMQTIDRLARAGTPILGRRYRAAVSLQNAEGNDAAVARLSQQLHTDAENGLLPRYMSNMTPAEALTALGLVHDFDCQADPADAYPGWIHRRGNNADIYFVANPSAKRAQFKMTFRAQARTPELWDPVNGTIRPLVAYQRDSQTVSFERVFEPWQSLFVVIPNTATKPPAWKGLRFAANSTPREATTIKILLARQGKTTDAQGSTDVSAALQEQADAGRIAQRSSGEQLALQYELGGEVHYRWLTLGDQLLIEAGGPAAIAQHARLSDDGRAVLFSDRLPCEVISASGVPQTITPPATDYRAKIEGPWTVRFLDGQDAPEQLVLNDLSDLSQHAMENVRYYSGRIEYQSNFALPAGWGTEGERIEISLDRVANLAHFYCNGQDRGIVWARPYTVDLTETLQPGTNTITIVVANSWSNRLIGDEHLPVDLPTRPNGMLEGPLPQWLVEGRLTDRPEPRRQAVCLFRHYSADSSLPASGLIGPVGLVRWVRQPITLPNDSQR